MGPRAWIAVAAIVGAVMGGAAVATRGEGQPPRASADGRYLVVNPTPSFTRNTMLLDTVTGQTWIYCFSGTETSRDDGWCTMFGGPANRASRPASSPMPGGFIPDAP